MRPRSGSPAPWSLSLCFFAQSGSAAVAPSAGQSGLFLVIEEMVMVVVSYVTPLIMVVPVETAGSITPSTT